MRRIHLYFSARDPRSLMSCAGRPALDRLRQSIDGVNLVPWPPSENDDVVYKIEIRRCNELGIRLLQNPTGAVTSLKSIPPECISEVATFDNTVLYRNEFLDYIAPGDRRRGQLTVGPPIRRASLFFKARRT